MRCVTTSSKNSGWAWYRPRPTMSTLSRPHRTTSRRSACQPPTTSSACRFRSRGECSGLAAQAKCAEDATTPCQQPIPKTHASSWAWCARCAAFDPSLLSPLVDTGLPAERHSDSQSCKEHQKDAAQRDRGVEQATQIESETDRQTRQVMRERIPKDVTGVKDANLSDER